MYREKSDFFFSWKKVQFILQNSNLLFTDQNFFFGILYLQKYKIQSVIL